MSEPLPITDPDDPRIEAFRAVRERDLTGRNGLIAEGRFVVEQLLDAPGFAAAGLLILESRLAGLATLLARVPAAVPVYVAGQGVFDAIAGFPVHRGVLAHGLRLPAADGADRQCLASIAARRGTVVVTVAIANHDNMGSIFRNAAAFGAGAVLVDAQSCDPLYRKAIRVSAGQVLRLPFQRVATGTAAFEALQGLGFRCLALSPSGMIGLGGLNGGRPTALFLGEEGYGLPPTLMAAMETLRIDMVPGFDSVNVATAGAIVLQALFAERLGGPG